MANCADARRPSLARNFLHTNNCTNLVVRKLSLSNATLHARTHASLTRNLRPSNAPFYTRKTRGKATSDTRKLHSHARPFPYMHTKHFNYPRMQASHALKSYLERNLTHANLAPSTNLLFFFNAGNPHCLHATCHASKHLPPSLPPHANLTHTESLLMSRDLSRTHSKYSNSNNYIQNVSTTECITKKNLIFYSYTLQGM